MAVATNLAACAVSDQADVPPRTTPIAYTLDASGVQLVGRSHRIDFGRTDHSAERAMTKLVGQAAISRSICADGRPYVDWADGTRLYFNNGAFRGWSKIGADGVVQRAGATCS
ncbi:hypothetical protein N9M66_00195 [Litoreibacter sp.]|nr:hypothetical protein [Litoreibacter sp.]